MSLLRGLYSSASGMITKQIQMEALSSNISNMNTIGFKRDKVIPKSFKEVMLVNKDKYIGGKPFKRKIGSMGFGVGVDEVVTSFEQGFLEETGRNFDFAIEGDGFFTLADENGNERYSRDGRFKTDENGYLTNSDGLRVIGMDSNGNKAEIRISNPNFKISNDGYFDSINGRTKFCISYFQDSKALIKNAENTYISNGQPAYNDTAKIHQCFVERSNVDAIEAITDMLTISRSYESNQKVLQQIDETLGKTVNEVGSIR